MKRLNNFTLVLMRLSSIYCHKIARKQHTHFLKKKFAKKVFIIASLHGIEFARVASKMQSRKTV